MGWHNVCQLHDAAVMCHEKCGLVGKLWPGGALQNGCALAHHLLMVPTLCCGMQLAAPL